MRDPGPNQADDRLQHEQHHRDAIDLKHRDFDDAWIVVHARLPEVNRGDVIEFLEAEEPDYAAGAAMFGAGVAPILLDIIATEDARLASKAAYLAGLLDPDAGLDVLASASVHPDAIVRVAAAGALEH